MYCNLIIRNFAVLCKKLTGYSDTDDARDRLWGRHSDINIRQSEKASWRRRHLSRDGNSGRISLRSVQEEYAWQGETCAKPKSGRSLYNQNSKEVCGAGTVITRRVSSDGLPCSWSLRDFAVVSGCRGTIEGYIAGECHALLCIF